MPQKHFSLRLFAGCMPIAGRIDMLKLRYYWRISHAGEENLAFCILNYKQKHIANSKIGYIHEVFKLCRKYNCLDVWLKIRRPMENPSNSIKRSVEQYYLEIDYQKCLTSPCMYSSFFSTRNIQNSKKIYAFDKFFNQIGLFPETNSRRLFIFALLDKCNFERTCHKCNGKFFDVLNHAVHECPHTVLLRLRLETKLKLYNAPVNVEVSKKEDLFSLALNYKGVFLKVLCEFLTDIAN